MWCPDKNSKDFKDMVDYFGDELAYHLWDKNGGNPIRLTPKGEESPLYAHLKEVYGSDELAAKAKAKIHTQAFKDTHGNWTKEGVEPNLKVGKDKIIEPEVKPEKKPIFETLQEKSKKNQVKEPQSQYGKKIPETIKVYGKERPTTNSKGRQIFPTEKGIINFWKWFDESKVVDEQGRPIVVYSGHSNVELFGDKFDNRKAISGGHYMSESPEVASGYSIGKIGDKREFENGDQYRLAGKNGELNKKLWQVELTDDQKKIIDEMAKEKDDNDEDVYPIREMRNWAKQNERYDPIARKLLYQPYNLQNIWAYNEQSGYNIAYPKAKTNKDDPYYLLQQKNDTELMLDKLGIKWSSADWHVPGVMALYTNISKPIDADKPFPQNVLDDLKKIAKRERVQPEGIGWNTTWTKDYPIRQFVKDIESGTDSLTTQVPKKALEVFKKYGYDGYKERGNKGSNLPRSERNINWVAFDGDQIKSATGNKGTFNSDKNSLVNEPNSDYLRTTEINNAYGSDELHKDAIEKTISLVEDARKLRNDNRGQYSLWPDTKPDKPTETGNKPVSSASKVLPRTVSEDFKEAGYVDVVGRKINSPQDIADLWAIHRSPYIEKAHVIFVKEGKIIGSSAMTINSSYQAAFLSPQEVLDLYHKFGADGVYYLHNHPSGNHKVSVNDVYVTAMHGNFLKNQGANLIGHVVIDHDKFSYIDVNKNPIDTQFDQRVYDEYAKYEVEAIDYKNAVPKLFSEREKLPAGDGAPKRMLEISRALLSDHAYEGAVVYLQRDLSISAYDPFPEGATPEQVIEIAKNGLKNNIGSNVIFIHNGMMDGVTHNSPTFPEMTLDVVNAKTGTTKDWLRKEQGIGLTKSDIKTLWEPKSEYGGKKKEDETMMDFLKRKSLEAEQKKKEESDLLNTLFDKTEPVKTETVFDLLKKNNKTLIEGKKELKKQGRPGETLIQYLKRRYEETHGTIGVSHDNLNELAKKLGLPEIERGQVLTPEEYADRGRKLLNEGVDPNNLGEYKGDSEDKIAVARAYLEKLSLTADAIKDKKSDEYREAEKALEDYSKNVVKSLGTKWAAEGRALQGRRDLDTDSFSTVSQQIKAINGDKPLTDKQTDDVQKFTDKTAELNAKVKELEDKIKEQTDKHIGERPERKFTAKKAAEIADNLLAKAKLSRPGSFAMASPGSIAWDGAIEAVAKSIKLSGKASDAINSGIEHIKGTKWYEGLTHEKQKQAEQDFRDFTEKELTTKKYQAEVSANKRIAELEKQLSDLQNGIIPEKKVMTPREKSDQENELLTIIKDEKAKIKDKLDFKYLKNSMANHHGNTFTPNESRAIWDYAKKKYLNNGTSFRDMISNVSNDLGMSFFQVSNAIITPKTKPITDELWRTRHELSSNRTATQRYINNQSPTNAIKLFKNISNGIREVKVFGHGGVFVGTHAGMTLMDLPRAHYTVKAFFNAYKNAYGNTAHYEMAMSDLKGRANYILAQRAGLQNNPDRINLDSEIIKPLFGKFSEAGLKGFNAIKILRQDLFDSHYNSLTPEEQKDKTSIEEMAKLINNATGGTNINFRGGALGDAFAEVTFAGGMELSRWEKLINNPAKAIGIGAKAGYNVFAGGKLSTSDKVFIKTWGKRVGWELGSYLGLLMINAALQSYLNDKKNPVNLTNPSKADWLKMKMGYRTFDFSSGMISTENFIKKMGMVIFQDVPLNSIGMPKYQNKGSELLDISGRYGRGKLAPAYADLTDVVSHHDYNGNTLPWFDDKPEHTNNRKLTWKEYLLEKSPLPIGEGVDVFYDEASKNGVDEDQTNSIIEGVLGTIVSGTTGFRMYKNDPIDEVTIKAKSIMSKGLIYDRLLNKAEKSQDTEKVSKIFSPELQETYDMLDHHYKPWLKDIEKELKKAQKINNQEAIKVLEQKRDSLYRAISEQFKDVKFPEYTEKDLK